MNKIKDLIDYKPVASYGNTQYDYTKSYYCDTNKIIHPNLNQKLHCKDCITPFDKVDYEHKQRVDNYPIHDFFNTTSKDICLIHNLNIKYFKPWL